MPKSISSLQTQLESCERNMQESFSQSSDLVGNQDYQVTFNLKQFIEGITTFNIEEAIDAVDKMLEVLKECEKMLRIEVKRRSYDKELRKLIHLRERKETIKRLSIKNRFKKKTPLVQIPSPTNSETEEYLDEE